MSGPVPQVRIGVVGVESSHVDQIVEHLNVDRGRPSVRVTALAHCGADKDRIAALAGRGGIDVVVDDVPGLLGHADVLVVADRDADLHREHAAVFSDRGLPVFVDKPLAYGVDDAMGIVATARAYGALLASYSPLRYAPAVQAFSDRLAPIGPMRSLVVTGPVDAASPYGGRFFYGIHLADVAMRLVPGEPIRVRSLPAGDSLVTSAAVGEVSVTLAMIGPDRTGGAGVARTVGPPPFQLVAAGPGGIVTSEISVVGRYVIPGLTAFLEMLDGTRPAPTDDELLRPIRLMSAALDSVDANETGR